MSDSGRIHRTQLFWVLCLVHGCSVGTPIVDKQPTGDLLVTVCQPPPSCDPLPDIMLSPAHARPIPRELCINAADLVPCDDDADGGVSDHERRCYGARALSELPPSVFCDTSLTTLHSDSTVQTLEAVDWLSSNLTIHVDAPFEIDLDAPALSHVFLRLEGPVFLHIDRGVGPLDLRITGEANAAGAPSLELSQLRANEIDIGDEAQPFPGTVSLRDLSLLNSAIAASNIVLESVIMTRVKLTTATLNGTDAKLTQCVFDADTLLLSAFTGKNVQFRSCEGATLVQGQVSDAAFDACSEGVTTHLYEDSIFSSSLDGVFELDSTDLENVSLGASEPTELVMFQSAALQARICDAVDKLQLGPGTHMRCSDCEQTLSEPDQLCTIPSVDFPAAADLNFCKELNEKLPPLCQAPWPDRTRPVADNAGLPIF